jgi:hypothetical protein
MTNSHLINLKARELKSISLQGSAEIGRKLTVGNPVSNMFYQI